MPQLSGSIHIKLEEYLKSCIGILDDFMNLYMDIILVGYEHLKSQFSSYVLSPLLIYIIPDFFFT